MAAPRKLESSRSFVGQGLRNRFTRPGLPAAGALGLSRARLVPALAEPLQGLWHLFGPVPGLLSWLIERQLGIAGNKKPAPRPVLGGFRAWLESPEKRPRHYWILPLCGFWSCAQICPKTKSPPFFRLLFDQLQASQSDQLHTDPTSARRRKATIFTASRTKTNNSSAPGSQWRYLPTMRSLGGRFGPNDIPGRADRAAGARAVVAGPCCGPQCCLWLKVACRSAPVCMQLCPVESGRSSRSFLVALEVETR